MELQLQYVIRGKNVIWVQKCDAVLMGERCDWSSGCHWGERYMCKSVCDHYFGFSLSNYHIDVPVLLDIAGIQL